jgi:glutamate 5-kinase
MQRLVIKLGTGILSQDEGRALDHTQFARLSGEVAALRLEGISVILVSSGAVAAGVPVLGLDARPTDLAGKQACAAVGQPALMSCYAESLQEHGLCVGQLLLSHSDIDSRLRRENARNTMDRLLTSQAVIPVVNENDSVAVEELRFGDNDRLSAEVAALVSADLLIILTGVEGLLDGKGELVPEVTCLEEAFAWVTEETGKFSVGGMRTKLEAARIAARAGIPTVIAHGRIPGLLAQLARGERVGTFISAKVGCA